MEWNTDVPPRGFEVDSGESGVCVVRYRTTGMGCAGWFFAVWLTGWTAICSLFTVLALSQADGIDWLMLLFIVPFWIAEFATLAYVAWFFWSVTRFRFEPDELVVERSLLWRRRQQVFLRQQVTAVKQVKDGGEGEDSFPSWGLVVLGTGGVFVLSRQPRDKSDWLGPVIAKWAGAPYIPYEPSVKEKYKVL